MQFSYGATVFNANLHSLTSGRDGHNQIAEMNTKSWSPTLYDADGNVFFAGNNEAKYRMPGGVALNYCTSKMLEDGSFLRIGDITLAYALGKKVAKKSVCRTSNCLLRSRTFAYLPNIRDLTRK